MTLLQALFSSFHLYESCWAFLLEDPGSNFPLPGLSWCCLLSSKKKLSPARSHILSNICSPSGYEFGCKLPRAHLSNQFLQQPCILNPKLGNFNTQPPKLKYTYGQNGKRPLKCGKSWKFYPSTSIKTSLFFFKQGHRCEETKLVSVGRTQPFQTSFVNLQLVPWSIFPNHSSEKFQGESLSVMPL